MIVEYIIYIDGKVRGLYTLDDKSSKVYAKLPKNGKSLYSKGIINDIKSLCPDAKIIIRTNGNTTNNQLN